MDRLNRILKEDHAKYLHNSFLHHSRKYSVFHIYHYSMLYSEYGSYKVICSHQIDYVMQKSLLVALYQFLEAQKRGYLSILYKCH
ncbi:Uncharacterised protein [Chlamydia trachomatis]|nr:Uncharacterised protein [Chlamydia trachomatis]